MEWKGNEYSDLVIQFHFSKAKISDFTSDLHFMKALVLSGNNLWFTQAVHFKPHTDQKKNL